MKNGGHISSDEDARFVSLCKNGDMDAFEALVEKYQKKMLNTTYRMLGNYEDACEVVQDTFVSAYKNLRKFKGKSRFSTWLFAIAMNHARSRVKKMSTKNYYEGRAVHGTVRSDEESVAIEPVSNDPPIDVMLEKQHIGKKVQECIKGLDTDFRAVLVLRDIQGFSYGDISTMVGIAEGTVKSRLFRARDAIKECLKKVFGEL